MLKHAATGLILIPILGIGLMTLFTDYQVENLRDELTERLLEILPQKQCEKNAAVPQSANDNSTPTTEASSVEDVYGRRSHFDNPGPYNSRKAMERRAQGLRDVCLKYKDFMRPENVLSSKAVQFEDVLVNAPTMTTFCTIPKVAQKPMVTLFNRLREPSQEEENRLKYFKANYPTSMKEMKRAILVRHPFERLISAFRTMYEKVFNPVTGEEEGGEMEWIDFIYVILQGPIEYAEFLEEHEMDEGSVAIDTGMIDGLGKSKAWAPYWLQCGVCNPLFMPDFIMHLDHFKEDAKTMLDILEVGESKYSGWMNSKVEPKSADRDVEEYYYGQLTKSEIRELHQKFKQDFELFGYSPEYYIAMGQDE